MVRVTAAQVLSTVESEVYTWAHDLIMLRFRCRGIDFTDLDLPWLWQTKLDSRLVAFIHLVVYCIKNVTPDIQVFRISLKNSSDLPSRLVALLHIPYLDPHLSRICLQEYYRKYPSMWTRSDQQAVNTLRFLSSSRSDLHYA